LTLTGKAKVTPSSSNLLKISVTKNDLEGLIFEAGKRSLPVIFGLEEEAAAETPSDEEE